MKGILIGALLLVAGQARAYSHSFRNGARVPVRFWVNYVGCSNDTWPAVKPGQTITWRSGLCCIKNTNAAATAQPTKSVSAASDVKYGGFSSVDEGVGTVVFAVPNFFESTMCNNTNWAVTDDGKRASLIKL